MFENILIYFYPICKTYEWYKFFKSGGEFVENIPYSGPSGSLQLTKTLEYRSFSWKFPSAFLWVWWILWVWEISLDLLNDSERWFMTLNANVNDLERTNEPKPQKSPWGWSKFMKLLNVCVHNRNLNLALNVSIK